MAVYNFDKASLKLSFQTGVDKEGKIIMNSKTYQNLRENAGADAVLAVAQSLASLSSYNLLYAEKIQTETVDL